MAVSRAVEAKMDAAQEGNDAIMSVASTQQHEFAWSDITSSCGMWQCPLDAHTGQVPHPSGATGANVVVAGECGAGGVYAVLAADAVERSAGVSQVSPDDVRGVSAARDGGASRRMLRRLQALSSHQVQLLSL